MLNWRTTPILSVGQSSDQLGLAADFTLDLLIEDLLAVMDHAGAGTVHFCGESMGGILGLAMAARHDGSIVVDR